MGCFTSKPSDINDQVSNRSSVTNSRVNQQVPPIVITKAHFVSSSIDSLHLQNTIVPPPPTFTTSITTTNTNKINTTGSNDTIKEEEQEQEQEHEKPPVIIEEQTQEHQYGSPPEQMQELDKKAVIKDTRPMIINTPDSMSDPTLIPVADLVAAQQQAGLAEAGALDLDKERDNDLTATTNMSNTSTTTVTTTEPPTKQERETWPIFVRSASNGTQIEKQVDIPTTAPFMTVFQLKRNLELESHQQVKLIHLGRILQDKFSLVPASSFSDSSGSNNSKKKESAVKLANKGIIQAMIYDK